MNYANRKLRPPLLLLLPEQPALLLWSQRIRILISLESISSP